MERLASTKYAASANSHMLVAARTSSVGTRGPVGAVRGEVRSTE